jgi:DNA repair protein REV1
MLIVRHHRTHILATNLTPAKFKEFVNYKVATPTWIVDSVAAGKLLDWKKYKLVPSFGEVGGLRDGLSGFLAPKGKGKERVRVEQEEDVEVLEGDPQNEEGAQDIATGHPLVAPDEERTMIDQDVPAKPQNLREIYAPSKGQAPALTTDPTTFQGNARLGYAKNAENQEAKRLMQSEEWREQNTAVSDKFLQGYYKNSRLHHLSTWKSELKLLVAEAQKRAEETALTERMAPRASQRQAYSLAHAVLPKMATRSVKFTGPAVTKAKQDRVIMHVDFDAFFVSCGLSSRPELKGKSVVVCHAQGNQGASSTSEIASCSYEARAFGVKNGMSLGQARGLCPDIRTIP